MKQLRLTGKSMLLLLSLVILLVTGFATKQLIAAHAAKPMPTPPKRSLTPEVSVVWQQPANYQSSVEGFGAVAPHYAMNLIAQVTGQIQSISKRFEAGNFVKQKTWLAKLENSDYRAAVASAQQSLADANVALLEEERQVQESLIEWQTSGLSGDPDSPLVLRAPQLKAAQSTVENAKAQLASANKDLGFTTFQSPFDAVIVERNVALGSFVQQGTTIATLYSADRVEIKVALPENAWRNLPKQAQLSQSKWPVIVKNVENNQQWQGYVIRTQKHLDTDTRQHTVIVAVDHPFTQQPALLPGTFVQVSLKGLARDNLWQLPNTALSQRGEVWYVDEGQQLQKFAATSQFSQQGNVYIDVPKALREKRMAVLTHPLNSYLAGMQVKPVEQTHE